MTTNLPTRHFHNTVRFVDTFDPPQFLLDSGTLGFEEETDFRRNGRQLEKGEALHLDNIQ